MVDYIHHAHLFIYLHCKLFDVMNFETSESIKLKEQIEVIPVKNFYATRSLEAYGDKGTYIIPLHIESVRTAYYGSDCLEHIRENDEWQSDKRWIKDYFLNNLGLIEIVKE